jgi:hypothetical protein
MAMIPIAIIITVVRSHNSIVNDLGVRWFHCR